VVYTGSSAIIIVPRNGVFVYCGQKERAKMVDHVLGTGEAERRIVTVSEAATILRISRGSAYEAAKRGEIPTIRIGRRWLVPLAALERMLAGTAQ
jgi:excisionase family DNA binding protein